MSRAAMSRRGILHTAGGSSAGLGCVFERERENTREGQSSVRAAGLCDTACVACATRSKTSSACLVARAVTFDDSGPGSYRTAAGTGAVPLALVWFTGIGAQCVPPCLCVGIVAGCCVCGGEPGSVETVTRASTALSSRARIAGVAIVRAAAWPACTCMASRPRAGARAVSSVEDQMAAAAAVVLVWHGLLIGNSVADVGCAARAAAEAFQAEADVRGRQRVVVQRMSLARVWSSASLTPHMHP
jgi:hypothetical protein